MRYRSTKSGAVSASAKDAVLHGLAPDGGLYVPEQFPVLPASLLKELSQLSLPQIAFEVSKLFFTPDVSETELRSIAEDAFNFPILLSSADDRISILELFHGPTLAFKDFGARFMARLMPALRDRSAELTVLVATSGDTGSAVANGFFKVPGTRVIVAYPSGKVSEFQERQFTTLGENITAVEVEGTFDDCQRLVKQAFLDPELKSKRSLASANSINIARLIPQSFYYLWAAGQLQSDEDLVFCVPSGNFGNLTAGVIAKLLGAPIRRFIAATNSNDVVPEFLAGGDFRPRPSIQTMSNAMDVGDPSNFARLAYIFQSRKAMCEEIWGRAESEEETREEIKFWFAKSGLIVDPHTAVGLKALRLYLEEHSQARGVCLATAHPSKFSEVIEPLLGRKVEAPAEVLERFSGNKLSTKIEPLLSDLKRVILGRVDI